MNFLRKSGLYTSMACVMLAVTVWTLAKLGYGTENSLFSLVSCLCGAAVFLVAPYTIIPASSDRENNRWMIQLCTSGFYFLVLLALLIMSLPALQSAAVSTGVSDTPLTTGLIILGLAFFFSLAMHFASVATSLVSARRQESS